MLKKLIIKAAIAMVLFLPLFSCRGKSVPKPRGYFRIDFPEKRYRLYDTTCPFVFEYPVYGIISYDIGDNPEPCWFNLDFPEYRAKLHISYKSIKGDLPHILKEANEYVYSHTIKADAISEQPWLNPDRKVYGILYEIKGNAASNIQFIITDSTRHFLRGALYFSALPNEDSLAPVINFFKEDIIHMIESLYWK